MIVLNVTGNVTADAITREYNENTVVSFTVASNNRYKQKDGSYKDETTFIRCAIWNNPNAAKLFYKGRLVNVLGTNIKPNSYADSNGNLIVNIDLRVNSFQVFGKNEHSTPAKEESKNEFTQAIKEHEEKEIVDDLPF
jgi:single-strand DNA-binding protein